MLRRVVVFFEVLDNNLFDMYFVFGVVDLIVELEKKREDMVIIFLKLIECNK